MTPWYYMVFLFEMPQVALRLDGKSVKRAAQVSPKPSGRLDWFSSGILKKILQIGANEGASPLSLESPKYIKYKMVTK